MKFIRGVVYSALVGTPAENDLVENMLKFDEDEGSFLHRPGPYLLYTGLIDFVRERLGPDYPIEINR